MNIVVTGASGAIGHVLYTYLLNKGHTVTGLDYVDKYDYITSVDLTDPRATEIAIKDREPDVIIHLAGLKNVLLCEKDPDICNRLNFETAKNVGNVCSQLKAKLLFMSSDYVFDGANGPFSESSPCIPATRYGKVKLKVEQWISDHIDNYTLIRTSGVYGYANDFSSLVRKVLSRREPFEAYDNLVNTPTSTQDLNCMITIIIEHDIRGTVHACGLEHLSRFKLSENIAHQFNLDSSLIIPVSIDFTKDIRPRTLDLIRSEILTLPNTEGVIYQP